MLHLHDIKVRLPRLRERIDGLAREIALWKQSEGPLLPLERHQYLEGLYDALAGLDEGLRVLGKAAERIEALGLHGLDRIGG